MLNASISTSDVALTELLKVRKSGSNFLSRVGILMQSVTNRVAGNGAIGSVRGHARAWCGAGVREKGSRASRARGHWLGCGRGDLSAAMPCASKRGISATRVQRREKRGSYAQVSDDGDCDDRSECVFNGFSGLGVLHAVGPFRGHIDGQSRARGFIHALDLAAGRRRRRTHVSDLSHRVLSKRSDAPWVLVECAVHHGRRLRRQHAQRIESAFVLDSGNVAGLRLSRRHDRHRILERHGRYKRAAASVREWHTPHVDAATRQQQCESAQRDHHRSPARHLRERLHARRSDRGASVRSGRCASACDRIARARRNRCDLASTPRQLSARVSTQTSLSHSTFSSRTTAADFSFAIQWIAS